MIKLINQMDTYSCSPIVIKLRYDKVDKPNGHLFLQYLSLHLIVDQIVFFFPLSCSHMLSFFVYFIGLNVCHWFLGKYFNCGYGKITSELHCNHLACPFTEEIICHFLQERAALAAASDPYRYVEKRKPIPDPQVTTSIIC